ncbi:hypothetical protein RR42_s2667 [Cupriavidus basilensis]|uniref:Uncharacterized protein n=1 Tax=Cupriavidus basilensis TaxID=68895 RepID=A0A0C4YQF8_9BURK|nr:hypothetical protein RR42_s2667 [Cupriavidus basilensis]
MPRTDERNDRINVSTGNLTDAPIAFKLVQPSPAPVAAISANAAPGIARQHRPLPGSVFRAGLRAERAEEDHQR